MTIWATPLRSRTSKNGYPRKLPLVMQPSRHADAFCRPWRHEVLLPEFVPSLTSIRSDPRCAGEVKLVVPPHFTTDDVDGLYSVRAAQRGVTPRQRGPPKR